MHATQDLRTEFSSCLSDRAAGGSPRGPRVGSDHGARARGPSALPMGAPDSIFFIYFLLRYIFLMETIFIVFIEFVNNIASVLCFGSLAARHVGSQLPDQGSNPHPLCWKAKS